MALSPIVFNNPELFLNIFNKVSPDVCVHSRAVCKAWMNLLVDKALWKPVMADLKWDHECEQMENDPSFCGYITEVLTFLKENSDDMKFIGESIKDDVELSQCLHTDQWTLEEFKKKGLLERSQILWKALHQGATPILVNLLGRVSHKWEEFSSNEGTKAPFINNRQAMVNEFNKMEKFSVIATTLIQKHKVLCNPVDVIYALIPAFYVSHRAEDLLVYFLKSGKDLSTLAQMTFVSGPASAVILIYCRHLLFKGRLALQDLIKCKLLQEQDY